MYYTDLGQKIGKEKDVVYVSTTQGRTWTELAQFALGNTSEAYLFLEHQLKLFRYLCHVRTNEFIINIIHWGLLYYGSVYYLTKFQDMNKNQLTLYSSLSKRTFQNLSICESLPHELK